MHKGKARRGSSGGMDPPELEEDKKKGDLFSSPGLRRFFNRSTEALKRPSPLVTTATAKSPISPVVLSPIDNSPRITPHETPNDSPQETPQESPEDTPQDTPQESPQNSPFPRKRKPDPDAEADELRRQLFDTGSNGKKPQQQVVIATSFFFFLQIVGCPYYFFTITTA